MKSTEVNLIDELNKIKTKDLVKIFNEEQIEVFHQLKRRLGGKFDSLEQVQNEAKLQIDCKYIFLKAETFKSLNHILC